MEHKTIGQVHKELTQKDDNPVSPIDIQNEVHKDYEKNLYEAIDRGKKDLDGDFFIVVLTKKERLLERVLRNYFVVRKSCPTPEWDQTVYQFHRTSSEIEFLWVLPSKDTCQLFLRNINEIVPEERWLLGYILKDRDGELLTLSKERNGEVKESDKLIKDR